MYCPFQIAPKIKDRVVEAPIVFRFPACRVLQLLVFCLLQPLLSPLLAPCSFSPSYQPFPTAESVILLSLPVHVLLSMSLNSSMLSTWYRIKKIGDANGYKDIENCKKYPHPIKFLQNMTKIVGGCRYLIYKPAQINTRKWLCSLDCA